MKLITWNIQWARGVDGRVDVDRIVEHARRFADFDVLCLQEVSAGYPELPGCDGGDQFHALTLQLSGYAAIAGVAVDAPSQRKRFGNMMFSRLPVIQVWRHLLPWPADGERSMQRMALEVVIDTAFGPLAVTTTHLEYESERQRAAQVERLRELHAQSAAHARTPRPGEPRDGPFACLPHGVSSVLMGDFNFSPDASERARLSFTFHDGTPALVDAWEIAHADRPHDPTVGLYDKQQWPGPAFACDFAFVSADLATRVRAVQVDASTQASDHQPLLLELDDTPAM